MLCLNNLEQAGCTLTPHALWLLSVVPPSLPQEPAWHESRLSVLASQWIEPLVHNAKVIEITSPTSQVRNSTVGRIDLE